MQIDRHTLKTLLVVVLVLNTSVVGVIIYGSGTAQANTENVIWAQTHDDFRWSLAVDPVNDRIYVGNVSGEIQVLDKNGSVVDTLTHHPNRPWGMTYEDGVLYSVDEDGNLIAYEASSDSVIFNVSDSTEYRDITYGDGQLHVADKANNRVIGYNASDGTIEYTKSTPGSPHSVAYNAEDNIVYTGGDTNDIQGYDIDSDSVVFSDTRGGTIRGLDYHNGVLAVGDYNSDVAAYNTSDGSQLWEINTGSSGVVDVHYDTKNDIIYSGDNDGKVRASYVDNGSEVFNHTEHDGSASRVEYHDGVSYSSGSGYGAGNKTIAYDVSPYVDLAETLNGTAENQNGVPVANATIEVWGVDYDNIDPNNSETADTLDERAEELLNQASDTTPPEYDAEYDLVSDVQDKDVTYIAAHDSADWSQQSWVPANQDADLSSPRVAYDSGETVVLSMWDTQKGGSNTVDSDLPGGTVNTERELTISRLGPDGSAVSTYSVNTSEYKKTGVSLGVTDVGTETHYAFESELPDGFYKISSEAADKPLYIKVGDPAQVFAEDLKSEANTLSDRADYLEQLKTDNKMVRVRTTTNADGEWSAEVPSSVKKVKVVAHSSNGLVDDPQNASIEDIRSNWEQLDLNNTTSSVYISQEPVTAHPPESGVTVKVHEMDSPAFSDLADVLSNWDFLEQFLDNETFSELGGYAEQQIDDLNETSKEDLRQQLENLSKENEQLRQEIEKAKQDYADQHNKNVDELTDSEIARIVDREMSEQAPSYSFDPNVDVSLETPDSWNDTSTLDSTNDPAQVDMTIPIEGGVSADEPSDVVVTARHSDGSVHTLNESQYSLDSGMTDAGAVEIEGYEMPANSTAVSFDVRVVGEDGVGETTETVENPHPSVGQVPSLSSVDVSTLAPQKGEQVSISANSDDTSYRGLQDVRVYTSDGVEENVTEQNGEFVFTPSQSDENYVVEMDVKNGQGNTITETVKLRSTANSVNWPTNVRIAEGVTGTFALAGDNVEEATYERSGENSQVSMKVSSDSTGPVHVYAADVDRSSEEFTVRVLDEDGKQIQKHRTVNVYLADLSDDSIVYRNGEPLFNGSTAGELHDSEDGTVIKTYTDSSGEANIKVDNNPSFVDKQRYRIAKILNDLPFGLVMPQIPLEPLEVPTFQPTLPTATPI